jgi:hypothetical protein
MPALTVDGLIFTFPDRWKISRYDEWSFYRNRCRHFLKAVDLLAISTNETVFLIEAKDYRAHPRTKAIRLADEVAKKVLDTLAAMIPSKLSGDDPDEITFSAWVLKASKLRVVLHLEQPQKHSKLFPRVFDPADIQMKLRQQLKPVDAHPAVVDRANMGNLQWVVS